MGGLQAGSSSLMILLQESQEYTRVGRTVVLRNRHNPTFGMGREEEGEKGLEKAQRHGLEAIQSQTPRPTKALEVVWKNTDRFRGCLACNQLLCCAGSLVK